MGEFRGENADAGDIAAGEGQRGTKPEAAKSMDRATIGVAGAASRATRNPESGWPR